MKGNMKSEKDILETLKKYVGEFEIEQKLKPPLCKAQRIHDFGEDMKSANELTGALQTLKRTYQKILEAASTLGTDGVSEDMVLYHISKHIQECTFLGNELFDTTLSAKVGAQHITLENPTPMPLLERRDYSGFIGYMQDKLGEIDETLVRISNTISNEGLFTNRFTAHDVDFNSFDPSIFLRK